MPYLGKLSAVNRAEIYEVGDITKEDVIAYILQKGIPRNKAEKVVTCVGDGLVFLESCVNLLIKSGGTEGDTCVLKRAESISINDFKRNTRKPNCHIAHTSDKNK